MSPALYRTRCLLCGATLAVAGGKATHCKRCRTETCAGCKHPLSKHRFYSEGGTNRHGSRLVCVVDNCYWSECRGDVEN